MSWAHFKDSFGEFAKVFLNICEDFRQNCLVENNGVFTMHYFEWSSQEFHIKATMLN